jgi:hypothetical protein
MVISSSDPANWLHFSLAVGSYAPEIVGVYWGPDQVKGTADDVTRTSGASTLPVNELYYIGLATAGGAENQANLDAIRDYIGANNSVTAPFTITCVVEIKKTGEVAARMTRSLPFRGASASVAINRDAGASLRVNGRMGQYYYIQSATNLGSPQWVDLPGPPVLDGNFFPVDKTAPQKYFRARQ